MRREVGREGSRLGGPGQRERVAEGRWPAWEPAEMRLIKGFSKGHKDFVELAAAQKLVKLD